MPNIDIYISYAAEDKPLATPLYRSLHHLNLSVFFWDETLPLGGNVNDAMDAAMQSASIAIFILSPEFAARKGTVNELLFFLQRAADANVPVPVPLFYRLTPAECGAGQVFEVYEEVFARFGFGDGMTEAQRSERRRRVVDALKKLSKRGGVENPAGINAWDDAFVDRVAHQVQDALIRVKSQQPMPTVPGTGVSSASSTAMGGAPTYDVFISHAGEEKQSVAHPLRIALEARGLSVFLDQQSLTAASTTNETQIVSAIAHSRAAVFILSQTFAHKKWTVRELELFLRRRHAWGEWLRRLVGGGEPPVLLPIFWSLGVNECKRSAWEPLRMIAQFHGVERGGRDVDVVVGEVADKLREALARD